ncbi:MAG: hypothetical protein R2860_16010 [Desulfobacterales bacterium]
MQRRLILKASLAARDKWGCTLIIVSHDDLAWLNACSDTRVSMEKGRIFSIHEEIVAPALPDCSDRQYRPLDLPLSNGRQIHLPGKPEETALIPADKVNITQEIETQSNEKTKSRSWSLRMALEPQKPAALRRMLTREPSVLFTLLLSKSWSVH